MGKLDYLSDNAVLLLQEVFKNQNLMKLIYYTEKNPLDQPTIPDISTLFDADRDYNYLTPLYFSGELSPNETCRLHIWFPNAVIRNRVVLNTTVAFQFVYHNNLALINIDGKPKIRQYEVIKEIVNTFQDLSIETAGILSFEGQKVRFGSTGSKVFGMYGIDAQMMSI